ncbi:MAG: chemotaxis protein CheA [Armatimonadota bacterium]|nr:chemotaxis protein CheA [bacterium]
MGSDMDMSDLFGLFLEEAEEQLLKLDDGFLQLEKDPGNIEILKEIFRAAHTLKGSSATMGLTEITELTHAMENLLDPMRNGTVAVTPEAIDVLLDGTDALRTLMAQVANGEKMDLEVDGLLVRLRALCEGGSAAPGAAPTGKADSKKKKLGTDVPGAMIIRARVVPECMMPSVRGFMIFNSLSMLGEVVTSDPIQDALDDLQSGQDIIVTFVPSESPESVVTAIKSLAEVELIDFSMPGESDSEDAPEDTSVQKVETKAEDKTPAAAKSAGTTEPAAKAIQTVRVGVDRLDTLMNLVAELVIDRTRMNQIGNQLSQKYENEELVKGLAETSVHVGRVVTELQEHIMKVRLLPVEQVFNRFPRMVRDLAHKAGKDVDFVLEGQETELDRSILEDIVDPLTHLLRNAVDHGVETPDEREAVGKSRRSRVVLAAKQEENRIIIEVQDDGHGISLEKVKAAAVKKGAISEETLARMSEDEALQLIFASGVSTAEKITDISGRGVGMDVVRNNIQGLSGNVEVNTELGKGTTFRINLPLTLAIIKSLVTGVGDRVYVIPLSAVQETFRCSLDEVHHVDGHPAINFRGSVLHLVKMGNLFGASYEPQLSNTEWITFVVVRTGALKIGLVVDRLIGEQEVVIKPLGAFFGDIDGVAGATILGDGRVALIVDIGAIGALVNRRKRARTTTETGVA